MCRKLLIYHPIAFGKDIVLQEEARGDYEVPDVTGGAFVCFIYLFIYIFWVCGGGGVVCIKNMLLVQYGLVQSSELYM